MIIWCWKEGRAGQLRDVVVMVSVPERLKMLDVFASGCEACDYRQASPGAVRGGSNKQQPTGAADWG